MMLKRVQLPSAAFIGRHGNLKVFPDSPDISRVFGDFLFVGNERNFIKKYRFFETMQHEMQHELSHQTLEMFVCFFIHLDRLVGQGVTVNLFQNRICRPSASFHDVCIRNSKSVLDGCAVMP